MAINFPDSPTIGDEFTGGGFTWTWNGSSWEKLAEATSSITSTGFSLLVGTTGNTTYTFSGNQPAGAYAFTSDLNDTTFDIYLISSSNENVGHAPGGTSSVEASGEFNKIVVYGATTNDVINFEYRPSSSPSATGDVDGGAAPFITSATPTTLADIDSTTTVTGGNFAADVEIIFTGQDAVGRSAKNIVRSNSTSLIVTRPDDFPPEQEPYSMTASNPGVPNPSTNIHKINNYFDAGGVVTWITGPSLLSSPQVNQPYSATVQAQDADGTGVSYAVTTGSLAAGLSINSSTGEISGTPTADGSYVFTITATDLGGNTSSKEFNFTVAAETDTVADILVIAGGGSGGTISGGGGGGAGGYREFSGYAFPSNQALTLTVGAGGSSNSNGTDSTLYNISSSGGGFGADYNSSLGNSSGNAGGSGGGATNYYGSGGAGNIGGYDPVEGYAGGRQASYLQAYPGAGGGGAAEVGENGTGAKAGSGGSGRSSSITGTPVFRGGGGAGGVRLNYPVGTAGIGGGGAENNPGEPNTGGGGGGHGQDAPVYNTSGGSGVVILRYPSNRSATFSGGVTQTTTTDGNYKVSVVTATSTGSETVQFGVV